MKTTKPITERLIMKPQATPTTPPAEPTITAPGAIQREVLGDGVCVLTFDTPGSSANVFNTATLNELNAHLTAIELDDRVRSVVLLSAKPAIFIAGADLHALSSALDSPAEVPSPGLVDFIALGQRVFVHLASLRIPTVAAVHGACVGGGMEVSLACDYRIASTDKSTKLGLPETQLGILPAWGGCTRLPKLIGLPAALDLILKGKVVPARKALKLGLVDSVVPKERLLDMARQLIRRGKRSTATSPRQFVTTNRLIARMMLPFVRAKLMRETYGHYPAVLQALEVICHNVGDTLENSLQRERDAIEVLATTEACRNLMRLFFLQERAKKVRDETGYSLRPPARSAKQPVTESLRLAPIKQTAVIGAGVMGAGIAQWLSSHKMPVILRNVAPDQVGRGMSTIQKLYREATKRHVMTPLEAQKGLDLIRPAATEVPLRDVDLVIEAAVEKMDLKKAIFRKLAETSGPNTILATNTSALSVSEIAAATNAPERVVGIHFFNPVHRMQLVEVVVGHQTDPVVLDRTVRFVQQIGKLPVVVSDSPGFLVNRILMPYLMEAATLFMAGASIEDIDGAMLEFGMPMGPLRLVDEVGLDVAHHVAETLSYHFQDRMHTPAILNEMTAAGLLGRKTEHGFYHHQMKQAAPNEAVKMFQEPLWAARLSREALQRRMVLLMINEAARCLEEEVVTAPEDVDFAMVMGTGFAPFLGGPLRYADTLGIEHVVKALQQECDAHSPYFAPCALLQRKLSKGETFYPQKGIVV